MHLSQYMPTNSTSRHEVTEAYSTTECQSCLAADAEGLEDAVLGTWIPGEVWLFLLWFSEMGKTLDRISYKTNYSFPLICILRMCFKICIPSCAKVWNAVWCFSLTWTYENQEGAWMMFLSWETAASPAESASSASATNASASPPSSLQ